MRSTSSSPGNLFFWAFPTCCDLRDTVCSGRSWCFIAAPGRQLCPDRPSWAGSNVTNLQTGWTNSPESVFCTRGNLQYTNGHSCFAWWQNFMPYLATSSSGSIQNAKSWDSKSSKEMRGKIIDSYPLLVLCGDLVSCQLVGLVYRFIDLRFIY